MSVMSTITNGVKAIGNGISRVLGGAAGIVSGAIGGAVGVQVGIVAGLASAREAGMYLLGGYILASIATAGILPLLISAVGAIPGALAGAYDGLKNGLGAGLASGARMIANPEKYLGSIEKRSLETLKKDHSVEPEIAAAAIAAAATATVAAAAPAVAPAKPAATPVTPPPVKRAAAAVTPSFASPPPLPKPAMPIAIMPPPPGPPDNTPAATRFNATPPTQKMGRHDAPPPQANAQHSPTTIIQSQPDGKSNPLMVKSEFEKFLEKLPKASADITYNKCANWDKLSQPHIEATVTKSKESFNIYPNKIATTGNDEATFAAMIKSFQDAHGKEKEMQITTTPKLRETWENACKKAGILEPKIIVPGDAMEPATPEKTASNRL
ncbi:MAG: hypothetical protein P4M12_07755 [Gammaproteobacteria bacterium]|nr:hypothetical protein [Gammaproteobacteria bacterium]